MHLEYRDTALSQILEYAFLAAVSGTLAFPVARVLPEAMREGSWVWLIPVILEFAAAVDELFVGGVRTMLDLFFKTQQGEGGAFAIALLTMPTWSCCWYSATMLWQRRGRPRRPAGRRFVGP